MLILDNWQFTWTRYRNVTLPDNSTRPLIDLCQPEEGPTWRVRTVQEFKLTLSAGKYRIRSASLEYVGLQDAHEVMIPYRLRNSNDEPLLIQCSLVDGKESLKNLPYFIYLVGATSGIRIVNMLSISAIAGAMVGGIWGSFEGTTFPGSYANWEYQPGRKDSWGYSAASYDFPPLNLPQAEVTSLHEQGISLPQEFYGKNSWGVWLQHQQDAQGGINAIPRFHQFSSGAHRLGPDMYHEFTVRKLFQGAVHGIFAEPKQSAEICAADTGQRVDVVSANTKTEYFRSKGLPPYIPEFKPYPPTQTRRSYLVTYSDQGFVNFVSRELAVAYIRKPTWVAVWESVLMPEAPDRHLIETGIDVKWSSEATAGTKLEGSNWTFEAGVAEFYSQLFSGDIRYKWTMDDTVVQDGTNNVLFWDAPAEDQVFKLDLLIYDSGGTAQATDHQFFVAQVSWRRA